MTVSSRGLPRWFDVTLACLGLAVALPVLALIAIAVAATSRGSVLYRHPRMGRGGRPFEMLKFRTMHAGRSGPQVTSSGDPRVTGVGRLLRRSKLDELPELWNVIRGDMALVGPRPESPAYVDVTDRLWQDVLQARPGLTDPTTLRLRNEEELLGRVGPDHEAFYRRSLVPYKLRGYRQYLAARTWRSDLVVLARTALGVVLPQAVPLPSLEEITTGPASLPEIGRRVRPQPVGFDAAVERARPSAWFRRRLSRD